MFANSWEALYKFHLYCINTDKHLFGEHYPLPFFVQRLHTLSENNLLLGQYPMLQINNLKVHINIFFPWECIYSLSAHIL